MHDETRPACHARGSQRRVCRKTRVTPLVRELAGGQFDWWNGCGAHHITDAVRFVSSSLRQIAIIGARVSTNLKFLDWARWITVVPKLHIRCHRSSRARLPASALKWIWHAADVTCKDLSRGADFFLARARLAWPKATRQLVLPERREARPTRQAGSPGRVTSALCKHDYLLADFW